MILKHLVLIAIGIANVSAADGVHAAAVTTEDTQTNLRATADDNERELVDTIATAADLDVVSPADDMKLTDENKVRRIGSYNGISYDQILCMCNDMVAHIMILFDLYIA